MATIIINNNAISGILSLQVRIIPTNRELTTVSGKTIVKKLYDRMNISLDIDVRTQERLKQFASLFRSPLLTVTYLDPSTGTMRTGTFSVASTSGPACIQYPTIWGSMTVELDGAEAIA